MAVAAALKIFAGAFPSQQARIDANVVTVWCYRLRDADPSAIVLAADLWLDEHEDWMPTCPQFEEAVWRIIERRKPPKWQRAQLEKQRLIELTGADQISGADHSGIIAEMKTVLRRAQ
jgi:hypothetical protein